MTSIALTSHHMSPALRPIRTTTATVVDRPVSRGRSRDLADSIRAYYVAKVSVVVMIVAVALGAGAFIGQL